MGAPLDSFDPIKQKRWCCVGKCSLLVSVMFCDGDGCCYCPLFVPGSSARSDEAKKCSGLEDVIINHYREVWLLYC